VKKTVAKMNSYSGLTIEDNVIGTCKFNLNKIGKVIGFSGDHGKRKIEIMLENGRQVSYSRRSVKKIQLSSSSQVDIQHDRAAAPQITNNIDEIMSEESFSSSNSSTDEELDISQDREVRYVIFVIYAFFLYLMH
jgi:hypothetical protein